MRADAPSTTDWIQAVSSFVSLLVAIAVAGFAWIQLQRERARDRERIRVADERIGATAFLLRRELLSWLGDEPESDPDHTLRAWLADQSNAKLLEARFALAERYATELLSAATEASARQAEAARRIATHVVNTVDWLRSHHAAGPAANAGLSRSWDIISWFTAGRDALKSAIVLVDTKVVGSSLAQSQRELDDALQDANPWKTLARELRGRPPELERFVKAEDVADL
jgi:hypothetical protein